MSILSVTVPLKRTGNMEHKTFDEICSGIEKALGDDYTGRVDYADGRPPLAIYHTTMDGKEYVITIIPTDLTGPAPK
jgi:hypothetical protein